MHRTFIYIFAIIVVTVSSMLIAGGCYNSYAEDIITNRLQNAPREPDSDILRGAAPISIDRGRDRVCLLLHGYSSSPADFGQLPAHLDDNGWDVQAPLLPAHGRDPRDLADTTADDLVAFARQQLAQLREEYDVVTLGGFSMGGSLALILTHKEQPDATFLINPYLGSTYKFYYILPPEWWYTILNPFVDYGVQLPGRIPVNRPEGRDEFVFYRAAPASIYAELFELKERAQMARHDDVPVLMLVSQDDATASPCASINHFQRTSTLNDRLIRFARSNHLLLLDYDRKKAIQSINSFMSDNVPNGISTSEP